ncbi:MAG: hypothetical protein FJ207_02835 [Gemmatimonadetes bacterium]|nr:hypothetical protein [Gemmatimonadota bacterium]
MDSEGLATLVVPTVSILTIGAVIILRPIAKRLTDLIELYSHDRQVGMQAEVQQLRDVLETMNARLQLLEERQDFTDRLLAPEGKTKEKRPELPRLG